MNINMNMSAILASNSLSKNDDALSKSIERLSTGLKINHAKDNASGLAISRRMNAQIEGLGVASQNASDGVSVIEIADGALSEIQDMTHRMSELAVKASNGTITDSDRTAVQAEIVQIKAEVERIAKNTEYNGKTLMDGSFDLKGYSDTAGVKVNSYSDEVSTAQYEMTVSGFDGDGNALVTLNTTAPNNFPSDAVAVAEGSKITISASGDFNMEVELDSTFTAPATATLDITGLGAMRLQIGANEGQVLELRIPTVSLETMGIEDMDVSTETGAKEAITMAEEANDYISAVRSRLGAYQNRLESSVSSLDITSENMTSAYSRIMDLDMATEMTEYTTNQVLTQSATSMLAQANERPQQVLQLLQ